MDHFREEEILSRAPFAGRPAVPGDRSGRSGCPAGGNRGVRRHDRSAVAEFVTGLTDILGGRPFVLLYLDGSPERSIARAVQREDSKWLSWLVGRFEGVDGDQPVVDEESLCRQLRGTAAGCGNKRARAERILTRCPPPTGPC